MVLSFAPASSAQSAVNNLAFADVEDYVNIRIKPDEGSEILGKLYKDSAATILEENEDWYKVKSGTVTGYIKSEFLATGKDAKKLSEKVGQTIATVTAKSLRVRSKASTSSKIIKLISKGDTYVVTGEQEDWVKVSVNGNTIGYVASDYVELTKKYEEAVAIKKENSTIQSLRDQIVSFAVKFEGNPYRYGGTSLTNGADCSGFTQSIFKKYGITIPRTSKAQSTGGKKVALNKIKPGDLIFYRRNGSINHVALYIGNGKVITAKSSSEGIQIKNYNYRTPYKAVSYLG
jgi:cell wall-associated NlpC family hydrolase